MNHKDFNLVTAGQTAKPMAAAQPIVAYIATRPCLISVSRRRLKVVMSPWGHLGMGEEPLENEPKTCFNLQEYVCIE